MNGIKRPLADTFMVFTLFFAYTLSSLLLAIIGANVYSNTVEISQANYDVRTSALYLTQKIRQSEQLNSVAIDEFNGVDALVITERYGEYTFNTWVYIENGFLCEAVLSEGVELIPNMGQNIMPLSEMFFELDDSGILHLNVVTVNGSTYHSKVYLECQEEGAA